MRVVQICPFVAAVLALCPNARGESLLITGAEADEPKLVFCNYEAPDQPAVQDIGVPAGGLDAAAGLPDDLATIVLRSGPPTGWLDKSEWPVAVACGIKAEPLAALKVEMSVVSGSYLLETGQVDVFWNGEQLATFDGTGKQCPKSQQAIRDFSVAIPREKVKTENLLHVSPHAAGPLAMVDAIGLSGEAALEFLPQEKTRALFRQFGEYEDRSVEGKGKILVCAPQPASNYSLAQRVCRALRADVTCLPVGSKWVSPSEWEHYRLVVLDTDHAPTAEEQETIVNYARSGGTLILTPVGLFGLLRKAQAERDGGLLKETPDLDTGDGKDISLLDCLGGFGVSEAESQPRQYEFRVKSGASLLTAVGLSDQASFSMTTQSGQLFTVSENTKQEDVLVDASLAQKTDKQFVALYMHRVGKGAVIGTALPETLQLVKMLRNVVFAVMNRSGGGQHEPFVP
jgi:hypothetical protein